MCDGEFVTRRCNRLHWVSVSPYVRKVQAVLNTKGINCTITLIIPLGDESELLSLNPSGKIPVYQNDEVTLSDSSVICAYLDKKSPRYAALSNRCN
jgi:glutathione S-transferase